MQERVAQTKKSERRRREAREFQCTRHLPFGEHGTAELRELPMLPDVLRVPARIRQSGAIVPLLPLIEKQPLYFPMQLFGEQLRPVINLILPNQRKFIFVHLSASPAATYFLQVRIEGCEILAEGSCAGSANFLGQGLDVRFHLAEIIVLLALGPFLLSSCQFLSV
jgi:hypothetical protein